MLPQGEHRGPYLFAAKALVPQLPSNPSQSRQSESIRLPHRQSDSVRVNSSLLHIIYYKDYQVIITYYSRNNGSIITRSIIGNNGSIITYYSPGQLGDDMNKISRKIPNQKSINIPMQTFLTPKDPLSSNHPGSGCLPPHPAHHTLLPGSASHSFLPDLP